MRGVSNCAAPNGAGSSSSKSPSQSSGGMQARTHTLEWLELGGPGIRFAAVTAMVPVGGGGSFDLSAHTCGMLTGELLSRRDVVYDFSRRRVALLEPGVGEGPRSKL